VVQPAQGIGPGPAQTVAAVDQQLQRDRDVIDDGLTQTVGAQRGHGDAVRVGGIGLAALGGVEQASPRGQLRRHVEDGFAVSDKTLGDVPADAVAAFHRPDTVPVLPTQLEHRGIAVAVGAEPTLCQDLLPAVDDFDGRGPLVRIHAR
jgi:hypothetical protein